MTITGANPRTAVPESSPSRERERERERELRSGVYIHEREGERERQPVRERGDRWLTITTPETRPQGSGTGYRRPAELVGERERERS